MSLPVVLRPEAVQDLEDIKAWYNGRLPGLGDTFARRAAKVLDTIGQLPELYGFVWQDVRAATIKRHPHVVYYRVHADRVEVFAVLHGRQDAAAWQARA